MKASSLEKSLSMLKEVESRLSKALAIQPKSTREVMIEIKDVKVKPREESNYQKSGSSQDIYNKLSNNGPSARLKTYQSESKSSAVEQLKAENKQLKKYIQLLEKINQNLRVEIRRFMRKSQLSFTAPKDISIYYESDQLSFLKSELECLRKINSVQSQQLKQLREHRLSQPRVDIYQYISPQKLRQQKSKLVSKTSLSIPQYNSYCECDGNWRTAPRAKVSVGSKLRSKTEHDSRSVLKDGKIGTITKKKNRKR